jgi:hypothetical protein
MKTVPYTIDSRRYEADVVGIPILLAVRTIHTFIAVGSDQLAFYTTLGGGPFFGIRSPRDYKGDDKSSYVDAGFGGELHGAFGAELFHSNCIAYSLEAGVSYFTIPTRNFTQKSSFFSPSLSLGIRFY